jgi:transposase-like protein
MSEDETEIGDRESASRAGHQGHPPCDRKQYSAEEKIRIVLEGLRGEESIAALCQRVIRHAKLGLTQLR